jgi:hypothetical protein
MALGPDMIDVLVPQHPWDSILNTPAQYSSSSTADPRASRNCPRLRSPGRPTEAAMDRPMVALGTSG